MLRNCVSVHLKIDDILCGTEFEIAIHNTFTQFLRFQALVETNYQIRQENGFK